MHTSLFIFFIRIRFTVVQIALFSSHSYNHEKNIYIQKNAKHLQVSLPIHCHWNLTSAFHDLHTTLLFLHSHQSQALPTLCWHRILNSSLPVPLGMTLHLCVCGSLSLWWNLSPKEQRLNLVCSASCLGADEQEDLCVHADVGICMCVSACGYLHVGVCMWASASGHLHVGIYM